MTRPQRLLPILTWVPAYDRRDLGGDLAAGITVGTMLVPQAMAYALLAGLPPAVGLYAATVPVLVYSFFGTSRQLAVGPVAIVSLMTASALGSLAGEDSIGYLAAAAMLALMVGAMHIVLGVARLGGLVNLLPHPVLIGFTAAAAVIIGFSQFEHLLGVRVESGLRFTEIAAELALHAGDAHRPTLVLGVAAIIAMAGLRRLTPRLPAALVVLVGSIVANELLDLESRGVAVVGSIPDSLPAFGLPKVDGSLVADLLVAALLITMVGFMESIAVAKVYARRHRYELDPNRELVGLGAANVAAGMFGGQPVTGSLSRSAVSDAAGARTPLASIVTASIVMATIAFFTPPLSSLPKAALGAIIVMAVTRLIDLNEMRHIAKVKRSDSIGLIVAFVATLALGIEIGIAVAVTASMLVVFARMARPHSAVLARVHGTTGYRNVEHFPDCERVDGVRILRIDAALSFVNAAHVRRLLLDEPSESERQHALILDGSGINDVDTTGLEMLREVIDELRERDVGFHLADVNDPVSDVLKRAGIWDEIEGCVHPTTYHAVLAVTGQQGDGPQEHHNGIGKPSTEGTVATSALASSA